MKTESDNIFSFFSSQPSVTNEIDKNLFPLVANEDTDFPFATYRIVTSEGETKDADKAIVTFSVFYEKDQYTECVTFSDVIENLVKQQYNWISTDVDFIDEDQSFVANINFEII